MKDGGDSDGERERKIVAALKRHCDERLLWCESKESE